MSTMLSTGSSHAEGCDGNELGDLAHGRLPDEEAQNGGVPESSVQTGIHLKNGSDESEPDEGARL